MTPNQVHLALLHFPIVLPFAGLALLAAGAWRGSAAVLRAALVTFVAAALLAWPVFASGHESEERLEKSGGASESLLEEHEEAATAALVAIQALGVAALVGLFLTRRDRPLQRWAGAGLAALALAACGTVAVAAHEGGRIRHADALDAVNRSSKAP